jgi:hypothetical protein
VGRFGPGVDKRERLGDGAATLPAAAREDMGVAGTAPLTVREAPREADGDTARSEAEESDGAAPLRTEAAGEAARAVAAVARAGGARVAVAPDDAGTGGAAAAAAMEDLLLGVAPARDEAVGVEARI